MKKTIIILCGLLFTVSCSNTTVEEKRIQKILHGNESVLWGIYNNKFESQKLSYTFHKNGECNYKEEHIYSEFGIKLIVNMDYLDDNWSVEVNDSTIYLRCILDVYRVIKYNDTYFKLLTKEGDTLYLNKSNCQSNDCLIPNQIPAPFW